MYNLKKLANNVTTQYKPSDDDVPGFVFKIEKHGFL